MPRPYSVDNLARLILLEGHDTASAARYFGEPLSYIQSQQGTQAYKRAFERLSRQRSKNDRQVYNITNVYSTEAVVPLDVTYIRKVEIQGITDRNGDPIEHDLPFEYNIGGLGRPGIEWGVKWFASIAALTAGTPVLSRDQTPQDVSINPPYLAETEGKHFFHLIFTPRFEGEHYVAFITDPIPDGQQGEPDASIRPYVVDVEGNHLIDADGVMLVSAAEQLSFLTDDDGYGLIDGYGNRLVEVI